MPQKIKHKRSSVLNKIPESSQLDYGEILVNYASGEGSAFLSIKKADNSVVTIHEDQYIEDLISASTSSTLTGVSMNGSAVTVTNNVAVLGNVVTAETQLSKGAASGTGNSVTDINVNGHQITLVKGATFTTSGDVESQIIGKNYITSAQAKTQIESYGYITGYTETDPTVPEWAKEPTKPTYTAAEVGALPTGTTLDNVPDGTSRKLSDYTLVTAFTSHTGNTNMHVTATEKNTWNNKQDAISDLVTIRSNAASGASAYTTVNAHTANTDIHVTAADKTNWNNKQDAIDDLATIRSNAASGASAYTNMISSVTMNGSAVPVVNKGVDLGTVVTAETQLSKGTTSGAGNAVTDISVNNHQVTLIKGATYTTSGDVESQITTKTANYFDGAEYVSSAKTINFKHGSTVKASIDATDFIKDGMVNEVKIDTPTGGTHSGETCLIVTFNTDAGKEDIDIPLSDMFNPDDYYTSAQTDELLLEYLPIGDSGDSETAVTYNGLKTAMENNELVISNALIQHNISAGFSPTGESLLPEGESLTDAILELMDKTDHMSAEFSVNDKLLNNENTAITLDGIDILNGSAITYSGVTLATSADSVTETFNKLFKEFIDDELVVSSNLNQIKESAGFGPNGESLLPGGISLTEAILEQTDKTGKDIENGDAIEYDGTVLAPSESSITDTINALFREVIDDEEAISSSLNDLNLRVDEKSTVMFVPSQTSGLPIGVLTINDVDIPLYAQEGGTDPDEVQAIVDASLVPYYNSAQTESAIDEAIDDALVDYLPIGTVSDPETAQTYYGVTTRIRNNERVIAGAMAQLNTSAGFDNNGQSRLPDGMSLTDAILALSANTGTTEDYLPIGESGDSITAITYYGVKNAMLEDELVTSKAILKINESAGFDANGSSLLPQGMSLTEAIEGLMTDKADIAQIATINGSALTNGGNLVITGGGGGGGGEENVITAITVNGTNVPPTNKVVGLTVPTSASIESSGFTKNAGTITGINMNGASKGTSGVVDLGTVVTAQTQLSTASTGNGNVLTNLTVSNHQITMVKGMTIPAWATASTKPSYTASEVGALPTGTTLDNVGDGTTRKLSNYATNANFTAHTADTTIHLSSGDVQTQVGNAKLFYGTCATPAATVAKEVVCTAFTSADLVKGSIIFVTFDATNTGAVANLTMSVNGTTAKPLKKVYNYSVSNLTSAGELIANETYMFQYDGTNWVCMSLDYNSTYALTNLPEADNSFIADSNVYRYQLLFQRGGADANKLTPLNNNDNVTAGTKTMLTGVTFDPFGKIFYWATTASAATNSALSPSYLYYHYAGASASYTFNVTGASALTQKQPVYLVVSPQSDGLVKIASSYPIAQSLPQTDDGYWYILLGNAKSATAIDLSTDHPVYKHNGTEIVELLNPKIMAGIEDQISDSVSGKQDDLKYYYEDEIVGAEPNITMSMIAGTVWSSGQTSDFVSGGNGKTTMVGTANMGNKGIQAGTMMVTSSGMTSIGVSSNGPDAIMTFDTLSGTRMAEVGIASVNKELRMVGTGYTIDLETSGGTNIKLDAKDGGNIVLTTNNSGKATYNGAEIATSASVETQISNSITGKQDTISDLSTIRNNAASGASAYTNAITGVTAGGTNVVSNKVAAIPTASTSAFGVIKTGNFLTNNAGTVSVTTGTTSSSVAVGNHTHANYATTSTTTNINNTLTAHTGNTAIHVPTGGTNGQILQLVNGTPTWVNPVSIYTGSGTPSQSLGNDGDIYLQTS